MFRKKFVLIVWNAEDVKCDSYSIVYRMAQKKIPRIVWWVFFTFSHWIYKKKSFSDTVFDVEGIGNDIYIIYRVAIKQKFIE